MGAAGYGGLEGRVLGLAGGGGLRAPLYAAAGAVVTVVDISPEMIEQDKRVANERGLKLTALASRWMTSRCWPTPRLIWSASRSAPVMFQT